MALITLIIMITIMIITMTIIMTHSMTINMIITMNIIMTIDMTIFMTIVMTTTMTLSMTNILMITPILREYGQPLSYLRVHHANLLEMTIPPRSKRGKQDVQCSHIFTSFSSSHCVL